MLPPASSRLGGSQAAPQLRTSSKPGSRPFKQERTATLGKRSSLRVLATLAIAVTAIILAFLALNYLQLAPWGSLTGGNTSPGEGTGTGTGTGSGNDKGKAKVSRSEKLSDFPDGLFHRTRRMRVLSSPDPLDPPGAGERPLGRSPTRAPSVVRLPNEPTGTVDHDVGAFTQGLFVWNGTLHESTGLYGQSEIRTHAWHAKGHGDAGALRFSLPLPSHHFGEGSAILGGGGSAESNTKNAEWFVLTWQEGVVNVYTPHGNGQEWKRVPDRRLRIPTQGWGLAEDPRPRTDNSPSAPRGLLLVSDGSHILRWYHPEDMREVRRVEVREWVPQIQRWRAVPKLNELEWIDGYIWANVWYDNRIAVIDPDSGAVLVWVDADHIVKETFRRLQDKGHSAVLSGATLNGIAFDNIASQDGDKTLVLTGKQWDKLYLYSFPLNGLDNAIERAKEDYGLV